LSDALAIMPTTDADVEAAPGGFEPAFEPSVRAEDPLAFREALNPEPSTDAEVSAAPCVKRTIREIVALSVPALGSTLADPVCSLVRVRRWYGL
jgi:hypothetical protein